MKLALLLLPLVFLAPGLRAAEIEAPHRKNTSYPPAMSEARVETYETIGDRKVQLWIFDAQKTPAPEAKRAAIVFFFGGGWSSGSPSQFEPQCEYLAARGMVAITADYRVATRDHVPAKECVADAKAAMRWVRKNAASLGIDPNRIAAGGGSAGGHLAAALGTGIGPDNAGDDAAISSLPSAMVLFNPAVVLAPYEGLPLAADKDASLRERMGCDPAELSPIHHVKAGLAPTLILHGKADTTVPYQTVEAYTAAMQKAGNRCELVGYEGEKHGFFNATGYAATLAEMDRFLVSLGYLPAKP